MQTHSQAECPARAPLTEHPVWEWFCISVHSEECKVNQNQGGHKLPGLATNNSLEEFTCSKSSVSDQTLEKGTEARGISLPKSRPQAFAFCLQFCRQGATSLVLVSGRSCATGNQLLGSAVGLQWGNNSQRSPITPNSALAEGALPKGIPFNGHVDNDNHTQHNGSFPREERVKEEILAISHFITRERNIVHCFVSPTFNLVVYPERLFQIHKHLF